MTRVFLILFIFSISISCGSGRSSVNTPTPENTVYVSPDGTGDGSTWANAASFTDAADMVNNRKTETQLWVKEGTYHFTSPVNFDYLFIYGGFKGGETSLEQRDWARNLTIFDGGGTSSILRNTVGKERGGNRVSIPSLLDGVIVQNGYLSEQGAHGGAVLLNRGAQVRNCIFRNNKNNRAHGGALFCQGLGGDNLNEYVIENSLFVNNTTHHNGGAVQVASAAKGIFINCTFANNQARNQSGGAVGGGGPNNSDFVFINTVAYNNFGNGRRSSYGVAGNINQGREVISLHSAIESASRKFTDGDDKGHIVLNENTTPGFKSPSSIIGSVSYEVQHDEIFNASYELSTGSPCINAGIEKGLPRGISLPTKDLSGKARVHEKKVDIGAYEYHDKK